MHGIFQKLAQCAPLSGYKENTWQIWSVTLLAPNTRRQTKGSVGVRSDLSDRNLMKLGIGFT